MGALLVLDFRLVLAALVVAVVVLLLSRTSVGSGLVAVILTPLIAIIVGHSYVAGAALLIIAALILYAHRDNLRTIFTGVDAPSGDVT